MVRGLEALGPRKGHNAHAAQRELPPSAPTAGIDQVNPNDCVSASVAVSLATAVPFSAAPILVGLGITGAGERTQGSP